MNRYIISIFFALSWCFAPLAFPQPDEKQTLTLYYLPYCPYCQQVLNHLKGIQKSIPLKNVAKDPEAKEELKKIGGVLEVPCLVIDEMALYRADPIIKWIDAHRDELDNAR